MRGGFERLSGMVRERMGNEPRSGAFFVFVGRRRQLVKIICTPPTKSRSESALNGRMMSADEGAGRSCTASKFASPASAERGARRSERHGVRARGGHRRQRTVDATERIVRQPSVGA